MEAHNPRSGFHYHDYCTVTMATREAVIFHYRAARLCACVQEAEGQRRSEIQIQISGGTEGGRRGESFLPRPYYSVWISFQLDGKHRFSVSQFSWGEIVFLSLKKQT